MQNIEGVTEKMRKNAVSMNAPLLRYNPHKRKFPCPKPCEVSVSIPVLRPTIIERIHESIISKEGISLEYKDEEIQASGGSIALQDYIKDKV